MAEYAVVDKTQLDADMTSVADTIRTKGGTTEQLAWPDGYKAAVEAIQTGSGLEPPALEANDADYVYKATRPSDWLPMPTPGDDEIYVLCNIINGTSGTFEFMPISSGSISVEYGTMENGEFMARETSTVASGKYENKKIYSADYEHLTSDGYKQCMVKIKGAITEFNGGTLNGVQTGVEIVCGISLNSFNLGWSTERWRGWKNLRYVSFLGNGGAKKLNNAFRDCYNILCIRCEKENVVSDIQNAFRDCSSVIAISPNLIANTDGAISAECAFQYGGGLQSFPAFNMVVSSFYAMFYGTQFRYIDLSKVDTSACTDATNIFRDGHRINQIRNWNISSLTKVSSSFSSFYNLSYFTLAGETTPGGITIALSYATLTREAVIDLINSLPVATEPATITMRSDSGISELTDEEIAVATAKNWTITA